MALTSNQKKMAWQTAVKNGEICADICTEHLRRRYIEESALIGTLAEELGMSVTRARWLLQARGVYRDRGHLNRTVKSVWNKGKRDPNARRHRMRAKRFSPEHRAKMAAAKRGCRGPLSNAWKGGHSTGHTAYGEIRVDGVRKYPHRVVAETILGRSLTKDEHVHHIDRCRSNNDPSNLLVIASRDHIKLHRAMRSNPDLDQRAWLRANGINFTDLVTCLA